MTGEGIMRVKGRGSAYPHGRPRRSDGLMRRGVCTRRHTRAGQERCREGPMRGWLDGAKYLGQQLVNGFHYNVWEKVDFIWYNEDVETKRPVQWIIYTGREAHVMTFEVGAVLEDEKWQAPVYYFNKEKKSLSTEGALREFRGYKGKAVS
ncbi:hypothetical protein Bca52824_033055 [Brassica carinata]|uniref:Uncharacterized protein n=1 Tax=Brassica carinata TaxID=52824 RepID=A0A8X7SI34_BRACI|nr:hypothetical protein Bca52824_033055 [Brassica carinata]